MFSCFGFVSSHSPPSLPSLFIVSFVFSLPSSSTSYSEYHFLSSSSSPVLSLHWLRTFFSFIQKKKKSESSLVSVRCGNVSSCRLEFEEVVMLSGITGDVGGGVVLCALTDAQCQRSRPGSRWRRRWAGVLALWHPSPRLPFFNEHTCIYSKHVRTHAARSSLLLQRPALSCHLFIPSSCARSDTWITWVEHVIRAWVEVVLSRQCVEAFAS